jgi:two-component system sensor histidine kinase KdpD
MPHSALLAIQQPLTALVTSAQLLEEDFDQLSPEQMRDRIGAMHRGAFWLHELVENMLCAATIRDGRLNIRRQVFRVSEVVDEVSSIVAPILTQQGQRLERSAWVPAPEVMGDPRRLGQVLVNLISNASEHSHQGTSVDVDIAPHGESVQVSVADRGPALPAETGGLPLESFCRPAKNLANEATGLGLAVARWIVEAHGGSVGARNRRGGGARFWFQLPTAA